LHNGLLRVDKVQNCGVGVADDSIGDIGHSPRVGHIVTVSDVARDPGIEVQPVLPLLVDYSAAIVPRL